jgi:hypothetical protein
MAAIYKYKYWCVTGQCYVYVWSESPPTACPNNTDHEIDVSTIAIVDQVESSDVHFDEQMRHIDGRLRIHQTPRPYGTRVYYTSIGDDPDDPTDIGNGEDMVMEHTVGGSINEVQYIDFNTIDNETYFYQALMSHGGNDLDYFELDLVTPVTPVASGSNTNYSLYGGYLIVPANGDGNITVEPSGFKFLQVLPDEDGNVDPGYWDAEFDTDANTFINVTPAPSGDGGYNLFATEIVVDKLVHKARLIGDTGGYFAVPSYDVERWPHGLRLKMTTTTYGDDHDWIIGFIFLLFRDKTV